MNCHSFHNYLVLQCVICTRFHALHYYCLFQSILLLYLGPMSADMVNNNYHRPICLQHYFHKLFFIKKVSKIKNNSAKT